MSNKDKISDGLNKLKSILAAESEQTSKMLDIYKKQNLLFSGSDSCCKYVVSIDIEILLSSFDINVSFFNYLNMKNTVNINYN